MPLVPPSDQSDKQDEPVEVDQPVSQPVNDLSSQPEMSSTRPEPPFPIQVDEDISLQPTAESAPPPVSPPPPESPTEIVEPFFKKFLPVIAIGGGLILIILLLVKLIIPLFQKPKQPQTVTLKYWGLWEPENFIAQVIEDYQRENPHVTIQYLRQSPKSYRERLQSSLAKGEGPDIFRWHNTWLPMLKADLSPLPDSIMSANLFDTSFYPIVKKDVFTGGRYYGIPLEFDGLGLYVNQEIFKANPDLKIPTTWDNLRQTAFKLAQKDAKGKLVRGGVALGAASNVDNFSDILGLMILQNGGNPGDVNQDSVISALKFYTLFVTQDRSWSLDLPASTYAFATNKVAMILAPSWRAFEIKEINPALEFKIYPVPQLPGTNITWASYWIEGVSQKSSHSQEAWQFLAYLSSKPVMTKMYNLASQSRLFGEPYSRQDLAGSLQADPYVDAFLSQAMAAQSWPLASRTFDNGLNDKLIKYYQDAINSYLKNDPEKNIIETLSQGVTQVLSQYGVSGN